MMQPAEQHGAKPPLLQPKFSKQISANVVDEKLLDQGVNLEELYLCCVDPQTSKTFKVNIGTQEAQEVHLKAGQDVPNKIKREIYKIDELLGRKEHEEYWDFKNEMVNDYRRRMVPFYLLGEESNQYPVYVDNSDIDLSFTGNAEDETFAAGITIEEITINMSDSVSTNLPFKLSNVSLLTTADQLIKMCERKLQIQNKLSDSTKVGGAEWSRLKKEAMKENYKNSTKFTDLTTRDQETVSQLIQAQLKQDAAIIQGWKESKGEFWGMQAMPQAERRKNEGPQWSELTVMAENEKRFNDPSRTSILKFKNFDSYIHGSHQLVYFVELRKFLRKRGNKRDQPLQLVFFNISDNQAHQGQATFGQFENNLNRVYEFPPLFEAQSDQGTGLERRKSSLAGRPSVFHPAGLKGPPKTTDQQIASRYKYVSLFGWYPPKRFLADSEPYFRNDWRIQNPSHGNVSFLKHPQGGLIPYDGDSEILKSCDIYEPLEIGLIGVKNLAYRLRRFVEKGQKDHEKPQKLPLMTFTVEKSVQNETNPANLKINSLLEKCRSLKSDKITGARRLLTDPMANYGQNAYFSQSFKDKYNEIQFLLEKQPGQEKVKLKTKEPFSFTPKYIQVQAALYLGCRRISCFSYSKPTLFANSTELDGQFLTFHKPVTVKKLQKQHELSADAQEIELKGDRINIAQLPSFTRLCMNIIVLPEKDSCKKVIKADKAKKVSDPEGGEHDFVEKQGFVFGSIQLSLFDENLLLKQGKKQFNLWPFEQYDPRMVCQAGCHVSTYPDESSQAQSEKEKRLRVMNLQIQFQSFASQVGWRMQDKQYPLYGEPQHETQRARQINNEHAGEYGRSKGLSLSQVQMQTFGGRQSIIEEIPREELEKKTETLQQIKKMLDAYPLDVGVDEANQINKNVEMVLEHRNYIYKLPVYIRLIDFTNPKQLQHCYKVLDRDMTNMTPEEALALLDGEFGDIKVRIFAVQKLSQLPDQQIALFMPQLVQALKYELFHHSPLAEFLLEKAVTNTRVVGHAFYWALKACLARPVVANVFAEDGNISKKEREEKLKEQARVDKRVPGYQHSQERFFVIQERFLMCCGQFKNEIFKQNLVNDACIQLSDFVNSSLKDDTVSKTKAKLQMHEELGKHEIRIKIKQDLIINHARHDETAYRKGAGAGEEQAPKGGKYRFDIDEINAFIDEHVEAIYQHMKTERTPYKKLYFRDKQFLVNWQTELMYLPFTPKEPISHFAEKGGTIFMSKKKPLLILCKIANEQESEAALKHQRAHRRGGLGRLGSLLEEQELDNAEPLARAEATQEEPPLMFMFKSGDDLRQDNLVLQFFKIMDKIWNKSDQDLSMVCYDVMESGFETGYIEFIGNATTITSIHTNTTKLGSRLLSPYNEKSIMEYFLQTIQWQKLVFEFENEEDLKAKLAEYHQSYLQSLAGQAVATYVLGIRDRHPGNYMLQNDTGKFFHIDFGHFLGHGKKKLGIQRDREPFVFSAEMKYFLMYFRSLKIVEEVLSDETLIDAVSGDTWADFKGEAMEPGFRGSPRFEGFSTRQRAIVERLIQLQTEAGKRPDGCWEAVPEYHYWVLMDPEAIKKDKKSAYALRPIEDVTADKKSPEFYEEEFEKRAKKAFQEVRKNADVFVNLLTLMVVCDLEELDQPSINYLKNALFLNVSEEEATVNFEKALRFIPRARTIDNIFHILNDDRKDRALAKKEARAKPEGAA